MIAENLGALALFGITAKLGLVLLGNKQVFDWNVSKRN